MSFNEIFVAYVDIHSHKFGIQVNTEVSVQVSISFLMIAFIIYFILISYI